MGVQRECIVCSKDSMPLLSLKQNKVYKCCSCELEFADPMPSESELFDFYSNYSDVRAQEEIVRKNARKNAESLKLLGLDENSRLLDFGCGNNFFVDEVGGRNWFGYDKYTYPKMPDGKFDFITLWGVLEHLVEPIKVVRDLGERLNRGGKIVITTVGTEIGIPYQYKVPEHVTWWSKKTVCKLLNRTGFDVCEISLYFMYQKPEVYLRCVLNVGRVPERIKRKIEIKSVRDVFVPTNKIFVVGRKRG